MLPALDSNNELKGWAMNVRMMMVALALAVGASPALAQDPRWYVGGSFGQSTVEDGCTGIGGAGVSCDDKDSAWRILGGYQVNKNFAVELGYSNLGEISATGPGGRVSAEATAWELAGLGLLPLGDRFAFYGKAGLYRAEVDANVNTVTVVGSAKEDNIGFTFGAGVKFDLSRSVAIRGEWQRYSDVGGSSTGESNVDVLGVGVLFKF